jgi:hypothetical protein
LVEWNGAAAAGVVDGSVAACPGESCDVHFFLCRIPTGAVFLVPVADRLGRAVCGLRD